MHRCLLSISALALIITPVALSAGEDFAAIQKKVDSFSQRWQTAAQKAERLPSAQKQKMERDFARLAESCPITGRFGETISFVERSLQTTLREGGSKLKPEQRKLLTSLQKLANNISETLPGGPTQTAQIESEELEISGRGAAGQERTADVDIVQVSLEGLNDQARELKRSWERCQVECKSMNQQTKERVFAMVSDLRENATFHALLPDAIKTLHEGTNALVGTLEREHQELLRHVNDILGDVHNTQMLIDGEYRKWEQQQGSRRSSQPGQERSSYEQRSRQGSEQGLEQQYPRR